MLPDTEHSSTAVPEDELYLAGTSEVPLASLHAGEILSGGELPQRYAGFSTCFRREAGGGRQGHAGHRSACTSSTRWRCSRSWSPSESAGRARAAARDRGGDPPGARDPVPRGEHRGGRPRRPRPPRSTTSRRGCRARAATASSPPRSNTTDFQARRLDVRYRPAEGEGVRARAHAERHRRGGGPHDHRGSWTHRTTQHVQPDGCVDVPARAQPARTRPDRRREPPAEAEGVGFEPTGDRKAPPAFKAGAFNRSATPPELDIVGRCRQYARRPAA